MRYVPPKKLKVLMLLFYGAGFWGIYFGLLMAPPSTTVMVTLLGVINLCLGGFVTFLYLTQGPRLRDKRKK